MPQTAILGETRNPIQIVAKSWPHPRNRAQGNDLAINVNDHGLSKQSSKRGQLLIECTREFSQIKRPGIGEIEQFKELFYQLVGQLSVADRRLVSAMLARQNFTPRQVALYFAHDLLEVAAPFLLFSPVLGDLDLQVVARKKGQAFIDVIKRRRLPMEPFTASKLTDTIDTSEAMETARPLASVNKDAEKAVVSEPADEKKYLEPAPDKGLHETTKSLSGDEIVALASIGGKLGKKEKQDLAAEPDLEHSDNGSPEVARQIETLPRRETMALLKLARNQDHAGFAELIEELCGLETSSTLRLVKSNGNQEILYLIRALGLAPMQGLQLSLMLCPSIGRSIAQYHEAKSLLAKLDPGICRMIFNEIGAKFSTGTSTIAPILSKPAKSGFEQAARRRRESLPVQSRKVAGELRPAKIANL
jgi:hypothetical protein